ncbi:IucA/IucC family C-terminal-domain containing protein [Streptomyces tsukubensis]|uniref:Ferric siderophore reductase C-terminal domain-containing protein n=1 Tax=Streptomyces tsukubensis TaxID=83656 RepID=A0A1V4AGG5_9ACTN|nr:IucA/IucC family C-terminal-domain containing protein [Streptomyces tsukubensis]OON82701.1 hypothetical protein B1H18_01210 [Streptomyces tsukubensis]QFR92126.1 Fe-S oxidoreductase [Streptomyces tsukubensis]
MSEAAAVLDRLASVGPYFTAPYGGRADPDGFLPLRELYAKSGALDPCVRMYAERMGTGEPRVAASTFHLGLVSRLWSMALGSAALTGRVLDLAPGRVFLRLKADSPVELWLPEPGLVPRTPSAESRLGTARTEQLLDEVRTSVSSDHLRPLAEAVRGGYRVSPQVLLGNAGSALVGSLRVLASAEPTAHDRALALVSALLESAPLDRSGEWVVEEGLGFAFLRDSCCLFYRAPGGGLCGDCVLRRRARPGPGRS